MRKDRAIEILAPLALIFQNDRQSVDDLQDMLDAYATALMHLSEAELTAGVFKCIRKCKKFPAPAEIMDYAQEMADIAAGKKHKSADEAWNEVQKQVQAAFVYKKPVFSTPEIETAALSMGWRGLCSTPTDQIGTIRAQFLKMYDSVCKRKQEQRTNQSVFDAMQKLGFNLQQITDVKQVSKGK